MKLSALAVNETTTLELINPNTEAPLGIFVEVHTPDSAKWKQLDKKYKDHTKKTSILIGKKGEKNEYQVDPSEAESREKVLIAAVIEITGIEDDDFNGKAQADIQKLLKDVSYRWMLEQIGEHCSERSNYFSLLSSD